MPIGLKRGTVVLEPHSDEWEVCAAETIAVLKEILGDDAVDIQHVGSTAIKGIAANWSRRPGGGRNPRTRRTKDRL